MSKFRIGDRVVVLDGLGTQKHLIGKTITIVEIDQEIGAPDIYLYDLNKIGFYDYELEFESIYNSPLYQALK